MNGGLTVLLLLVPALGSLLGALLPQAVSRGWALFVSTATLLVALIMACGFNYSAGFLQYKYTGFALPGIGTAFALGVDSISLWLVLLTVLLVPLAVLASFKSIQDRSREYYAWMLLLLAAMLGVFVVRDLLVFYIFFELTLVPMFFIIGIWGGPERRYAAGKFFLFTFTGSVFTLAGAIYLGYKAGSFDIQKVVLFAQTQLTPTERYWLLLALMAGFAVKVPLFPVHTWLPLAAHRSADGGQRHPRRRFAEIGDLWTLAPGGADRAYRHGSGHLRQDPVGDRRTVRGRRDLRSARRLGSAGYQETGGI